MRVGGLWACPTGACWLQHGRPGRVSRVVPLPASGVLSQTWQHARGSTSRSAAQAPSVDQLQEQLESLQQEAAGVRRRADGARARFIRLSEAAEQLRLRAALDVRAGKEGDAVRLLTEKQKVMQALELSKSRAAVLEELHAKLNQAISGKERQLIAALSCAHLDMKSMETGSKDGVRVVPPPLPNCHDTGADLQKQDPTPDEVLQMLVDEIQEELAALERGLKHVLECIPFRPTTDASLNSQLEDIFNHRRRIRRMIQKLLPGKWQEEEGVGIKT